MSAVRAHEIGLHIALLLAVHRFICQQGGPAPNLPCLPRPLPQTRFGLAHLPLVCRLRRSVVEALAWSWASQLWHDTPSGGGGDGEQTSRISRYQVHRHFHASPHRIRCERRAFAGSNAHAGDSSSRYKDVLVTSVSPDGSSGEVITTENISLKLCSIYNQRRWPSRLDSILAITRPITGAPHSVRQRRDS